MAAPKRDKLLLEVLRPHPTRGEGAPADWEGHDPRDGLMGPTLTPIGEVPEKPSTLALPPSAIYIAIAGVLGLVVLTWVIAYRLGEAEGRQSILGQTMGTDRDADRGGPVVDPTRTAGIPGGVGAAGAGTPAGGSAAGAGTPSLVAGGSADRGVGGKPVPLVITGSGITSTDPRVAGMNYLQVATLGRDQAEAAVRYLSERGVNAVAVPIGDGNGKFRVFSLGLAVPGPDFARMTAARNDHARLLSDLGSVFARDFRGGSDFSQSLWRRYDGVNPD